MAAAAFAGAGAITSAAFAVPSAGAASYPTSHTLTLSFLQDPGQPPDPDVYYAGQGIILQDNLYEGLTKYAPDSNVRKIIPDLATSWTVSANNSVYTLHLRHGVLFHDGTSFTSAAVKPSFDRRAAVGGGPAYMVADVKSVATPDPYTAVITLKEPNSAFLDYLASAYGPRMMSPTGLAAHAGKDSDQTYLHDHDLGTGPYTLSKAQVGVTYQLTAFPKYWGKKPYYTTVNFPVIDTISTQEVELQNHSIAAILHDLPEAAINSYAKSSAVKVTSLPTLAIENAYVNPAASFLTTAAHRLALIDAINLPQILNQVYAGRGTAPTQVYPKNLLPPSLAKQPYTFDPSKLKKLVASLPASERSFTIGYDTGSPDDQVIASLITLDLNAAGLNTKSIGDQTSTIYGWAPPGSPKGAPDLLVEYAWPDAFNPYTFAHIDFDPNGGINFLHCTIPGTSAQLTQAVATNNTTLYGKVGDEAAASGCFVNLANRNDVFVSQPWLKGLAAGHVVAYPYTVNLTALYPG